MPARRTLTTGLALAIGVVAGVALDRFALRPAEQASPASARAPAPSERSTDGPSSADASPDAASLASRPRTGTTPPAAGGAEGQPGTAPVAARAETMTSVEALGALKRAMQWPTSARPPESEAAGEHAFAVLDADPKLDAGTSLLLATWLAGHERAPEAVRRVVAQIGRRAPTLAEIAWLTDVDPLAAAKAARTLAERRPGSPEVLQALGEALVKAGDTAGAFDAYVSALEAGLEPGIVASEMARLDPLRAIDFLSKRYGGRDVGDGARALVEAYLRAGRLADAVRELVRAAPATADAEGLLRAAALFEPEATAKALEPRFADADSFADSAYAVICYGVALRRSGRGPEAIRVLKAAAENWPYPPLFVEMLRCDPVAARAFVEARMPEENHISVEDRLQILGLMGRRDEAVATFDRWTAGREPSPSEWEALALAAPDRAIRALSRGVEEARGGDDGNSWGISLARALTTAGRTAEAKAAWATIPDRELEFELLVEKWALK